MLIPNVCLTGNNTIQNSFYILFSGHHHKQHSLITPKVVPGDFPVPAVNAGVNANFFSLNCILITENRDRDEQENELREKLRIQWEENQKKIKEEDVEITYSYWDGSGHRKTVIMKKGNSIYQFLCKVLENIRSEFPELKIVTGRKI